MNTSLLGAGLCASVLAPAFTCSALLSFHPARAPLVSTAEHEPWYFEGDLGRDLPGRALVLTVSDTTRARVLEAYRESPEADAPPNVRLTSVRYGKVFGRTAATDTYHLLARLTAQDGTPLDDRPRLWRRTGPSPWRHLGTHDTAARVPRPLHTAWTTRPRAAASPCPLAMPSRGRGS
ncbi:hypothetical protein ABGB12_06025 [Actinocorallia sp. B10E7]|uniref:hypothetical protein n=1 Tax=Actinocorallia sp. B10E7 TaxID=3153558 RepID=UPI00325EFFA2